MFLLFFKKKTILHPQLRRKIKLFFPQKEGKSHRLVIKWKLCIVIFMNCFMCLCLFLWHFAATLSGRTGGAIFCESFFSRKTESVVNDLLKNKMCMLYAQCSHVWPKNGWNNWLILRRESTLSSFSTWP